MYPNQQYFGQGGGPNPPYSQQSQYNASGAQRPQLPNAPYNLAAGLTGGQQPNMSAPYSSNQGGYGGSSNPYGQGASNPYGQGSGNPHGQGSGNPYGQGANNPYGQGSGNPYGQGASNPYGQGAGNPYAQGSNPQGGNPYGSAGYGSAGSGGYPSSGQPPYGNNPYNSNTNAPGSRYPPPQGGGYPPQSGGYPPQSGGYPPQSGGYPPQSGGYPPQSGGYPPQSGGYPGGQPMGGFGGPSQGLMPNDPRAQQLNQIAQRYEIGPQLVQRLHILSNCEIVLLCDDSGSMNTPLQGTNQTRWDELKSLVNTIVDIGAVMDSNGIDVYFLNREPMLNVNNGQVVRNAFNQPPSGLTPLVPALRRILAAKRSLTYEKKLLILIATDGAPTNEQGQVDIGTLESVLRNERTPQAYVTFLACTDDLEAVSYLSNWDKSMPNLDVLDDYRSERAEIQRVRGPNFPFSFGDYIVKGLLGAIDPWFDSLDERA